MEELSNEALAAAVKAGNNDALGILLEENTGFLLEIVRELWNKDPAKMECRGFSEEDMLSVARETMWRCTEKYDPSRGAQFLTFAETCIRNKLKSFIRSQKKWILESFTSSEESDFELPMPEYPDDPEKDPAVPYIRRESMMEEYDAMQRLTKREQEFYYYWNSMDDASELRIKKDMVKEFAVREKELDRLQKSTAEKLWKYLWRYWEGMPSPVAVLSGRVPILPQEYTDGEFIDILVFLLKRQMENTKRRNEL